MSYRRIGGRDGIRPRPATYKAKFEVVEEQLAEAWGVKSVFSTSLGFTLRLSVLQRVLTPNSIRVWPEGAAFSFSFQLLKGGQVQGKTIYCSNSSSLAPSS